MLEIAAMLYGWTLVPLHSRMSLKDMTFILKQTNTTVLAISASNVSLLSELLENDTEKQIKLKNLILLDTGNDY
jgi:long-subunit acyl-CoA synthetase (AMP-forming)